MHEADHLSLISAEVTDQCSCNCDSAELHYGVHTDNFAFYHSCVGMAKISISTKFSATENEDNVELWKSVSSCSAVLCQNTEFCYLTISIKLGSLETSVNVGFPSV